ncbi:hypothetical protein C4J81_17610 [Deltaproteobacteria bacterium Smac51]|nr:hypothetical protein C4J81_17610 [Deltaproteobacteria bacterium Smac51]
MNLDFSIPSKNIITINPAGRLAICTLWTPPNYVRHLLESGCICLSGETSPVALIGGLFGGGLKVMLRNLLSNPQIEHLIIYGRDFSGAKEHLVNFFSGRVERTGRKRMYIFADGTRREMELISIAGHDSVYTMDEMVLPGHFKYPPQITDISFGHTETLLEVVDEFGREPADPAPRERVVIELPKPEVDVFPSEPHSHVVTADTIVEAWEKMLYRLSRFGQPVTFRDGKKRHELLNMKAVILSPGDFDAEKLAYFNLPAEEIREYQKTLLSAEFTEAEGSYTYGNRMRAYFGRDMLGLAAEDLSKNLDSRHNFITLWDNGRDLTGEESPCLVSLFFRKRDDKLDLTATFRSHNGTRAWPRNCFGLYKIMEQVCTLANQRPDRTENHELAPGTLTVLSLSISVDPADLEQVQTYIDDYKDRSPRMIMDPYGYVKLALDPEAEEIVVQHYSHENELLDEYRGKNPSELGRKLYQREVISDLSHAMYIGMQLERAWYCLLNGEEYIQDKTATLIKKTSHSS